ncbi:hypothetical protein B0J11DRAFT_602761 [Dendryphion nanum]|uniref:tyrosinase n=1 Tax=Dendryphion nanum TaxID=256645 RepID=A0A9P9ITJ2_9PLEO|nr:hypothetical protein B0J11DRAFT_602761 [Dendryphion nanum]
MVKLFSFGALSVASTLLPLVVFASPVQFDLVRLAARQNSNFVITGVTEGGQQPRLNIRDLQSKPEHKDIWTLYILALRSLQEVDQQDKLSWYQVAGKIMIYLYANNFIIEAGIHGQPWIEWDGVGPTWMEEPDVGYCHHNGALFATWHRPYMMLYEQLLYKHAVSIVDKISDTTTKTRFREAAKKLRAPYWDWAQKTPAGDTILPGFMTNEQIAITYPNGTQANIRNPLRSYHFNPVIPEHFVNDGSRPYHLWNKTFWSPEPTDSPTPTDNLAPLIRTLNNNLGWARERLFSIFSADLSYNRFSNSYMGIPDIGNLEAVHGSIHDSFIGGHMRPAETSAFDPVFWLHHSNVDRQLAIWQAIRPATWVESARNIRSKTYMLNGMADEPTDGNTPLYPFHKNAQGDFWTSNDIRDISKLGYTYPELLNNPTPESLKAKITELYYDKPNTLLHRRQEGNTTETIRTYQATVHLQSGLKAYFAFGDSTTNIDWSSHDNLVGTFSTVLNKDAGKDADGNEFVWGGPVFLSQGVVKAHEAGKLKSLDEKEVSEFLKKELKWKIVSDKEDDVVVEVGKNFNITIFSNLKTVPASPSEFPTIISKDVYFDSTKA